MCLFRFPGFGDTRSGKVVVTGEVKGEEGESLPRVTGVVGMCHGQGWKV